MNRINAFKSFSLYFLILFLNCISTQNPHISNVSFNVIENSLWIQETKCERIPEIPYNSSFNGIQKFFNKKCSKNSMDLMCEKYIACHVKTVNKNGDWSSWGPWNCDDCFKESKLAIRKRTCENFYEGYYCVREKRGVSNYEMMDCDEVCFKSLKFVIFVSFKI